ncbi:hypothetical protein V7S43_014514 [Phytophthora oleae]|uniref:Uncharacterized protein n=1 Tax=Phytophthora oleae TaxID=2107226 RepID=A0ABD3F0N8_9STRA
MECIKRLIASESRMKVEIGGKSQSLEILARLTYGIKRYGEVLTPEEVAAMSDVFHAVVHRSNVVVVGLPRWFAASKHDWTNSYTTPVRGTDGQIPHDVDLSADLHHPHVRRFFGACHVGENAFVIHEMNDLVDGSEWKVLLGCARGLEYVNGCGLVRRS